MNISFVEKFDLVNYIREHLINTFSKYKNSIYIISILIVILTILHFLYIRRLLEHKEII